MANKGEYKRPAFKERIPEELAEQWKSLSPIEKCLIKGQSIQEQKMDWVMERLADGDRAIEGLQQARALMVCKEHSEAIEAVAGRVTKLEGLRDRLLAKSSVVAGLVMVVGVPVLLMLLKHWLKI